MTVRKLAERRLKRVRIIGNYIPLSFRYCGFHTPLRIGCRDMIDYVLQPAGPIFLGMETFYRRIEDMEKMLVEYPTNARDEELIILENGKILRQVAEHYMSEEGTEYNRVFKKNTDIVIGYVEHYRPIWV